MIALALVAVACGSSSKQAAEPGTSKDGALSAALPSAAGSAASTKTQAGEKVSAGPVAAPAADQAPAGAFGRGGAAVSKPAGGGIGVTDTTIKIGLHYFEAGSADALVRAAGSSRSGSGYGSSGFKGQEKAMRDVVKYLNAHGGMGGRKIVPIGVGIRSDNADGWASQYQSDCESFTQDHRVFAVASDSWVTGYELMAKCMADHKTPYILDYNVYAPDQQVFARYAPYFYVPGNLLGDDAGIVVDMLRDGGYFAKGAKIGVVYAREQSTERNYKGPFKRRLAQYGLKVSEEARTHAPTGLADAATTSSEAGQAALRFQRAGITHVICFFTFSACGAGFQPAAYNQGYHPRYGFAAPVDQCMTLGSDEQKRDQCKGALRVSWAIPTERPEDRRRYSQSQPSYGLCRSIILKAGGDDAWSETCESLFFLKYFLDRAPAITPEGLRAAVDKVGTGYLGPSVFHSRLAPNRYVGASEVRLESYDTACLCYRQTDKRRRVP